MIRRRISVLGLIELTLIELTLTQSIIRLPCPVEPSKLKNVPNLVRHIATLTTSNGFFAYQNIFHEAVSFSHTLKMLSSSRPFLWDSVDQILMMYQQHISRYFVHTVDSPVNGSPRRITATHLESSSHAAPIRGRDLSVL